jgi:NAD(P)-dependent dehydrogenase (short-subunit alcohol dehydrogenase family)
LRAEDIMAETIALVTGANKGIGREISRQLSAKGVLVLMGARDRERGESAAAELRAQNLAVEFTEMDVTSQPSVDRAAAEVERRYGRLDILVNNAGVALDWIPGSELSVEALRQTFEVNVFGVFRVTKALLPLLKKSTHGRIVNMSSGLGSLSRSAASLRHEGIFGARLQYHIRAPPRLIVYQTPFVAGADIVLGEQHIAGSHHECLAVAGSEFKRSRQRNHVLQLGLSCQSSEECAGVSLK